MTPQEDAQIGMYELSDGELDAIAGGWPECLERLGARLKAAYEEFMASAREAARDPHRCGLAGACGPGGK
jgi:hypothetical protein